jgi:hypothetical protein
MMTIVVKFDDGHQDQYTIGRVTVDSYGALVLRGRDDKASYVFTEDEWTGFSVDKQE